MDFLFGFIEMFLDAFVVQNEDARPRTRKIVILTICALLFALCIWMTWSVWADGESIGVRILTIVIDMIMFPIGIWDICHEHKNGWKYQADRKAKK